MRNIQAYDNWHLLPMNQRNDKNVNPIPVDYMDSTSSSLGTDFIYKGSKDEAGALFSPKTDIIIPSWARFFGSNRIIKYLIFDTLAQDEFDWKFTLAQGQINQSLQINWKNKGGMLQWDPNDPPSWTDTGFNVAAIINPDTPIETQVRCSTDLNTWTLDTLYCNGKVFTPPVKRVPLKLNTGWVTQMAHAQEQAQITNPTSYTIKRYLRTQLIMSDGPIPIGWF